MGTFLVLLRGRMEGTHQNYFLWPDLHTSSPHHALCWGKFHPGPLLFLKEDQSHIPLGMSSPFLQPQHPQYDLNQPTGWILPAKSWDTRNATPGHMHLIAYSTTGRCFSFYLWLNLLTSVGKACYLDIIRPLHSLFYNRYWTVCCHLLFFCWLKIRHTFTTSAFVLPRNPVCWLFWPLFLHVDLSNSY